MCHVGWSIGGSATLLCVHVAYTLHFVSPQTTMPGMKRDCGGAAAILGAFRAAIKQVRAQVLPLLLQALLDPPLSRTPLP